MKYIDVDVPYAPRVAENSKFITLDQEYLDSIGYPTSGMGKHAILTYAVNAPSLSGANLDVTMDTDHLAKEETLEAVKTALLQLKFTGDDLKVTDIKTLGPETLHDGAESDGASSSIDVSVYRNHTIHIIASNVTDGATVTVETSLNGTDWASIKSPSNEIDENGVTEISISQQVYKYIRTNITNYIDGTYTTLLYSSN